jgi:hypothetical protein
MSCCRISIVSATLSGILASTLMIAARPHLARGQGAPPVAQSGPLRLEDGTPVKIRLSRTLSSATARDNERVDFDVLEEVKLGSLVVIPKGSIAWGTVTEVQAKRRMGRGGKLDVNIDAVRLANGDKVALRGVKGAKEGDHAGAMTGAMVATSLVMWPAAPFFLFMHGKDITIPQGTELTVYVNGDAPIDPTKFGGTAGPSQPVAQPTAAVQPTIILLDPSVSNSGDTFDVILSTFTIRGVVTDPAGLPAVTINGTHAGLLPRGPQSAEFNSGPLRLEAGDNPFEVVATNAAHLQSKVSFVLRYNSKVIQATRTTSLPASKSLGKPDIISLLKGGVPSTRVAEIVKDRGIIFVPTSDDITEIRAAGGGDDLVKALSNAKPRSSK